jgi:serine/threonine protein kinase
VLLPEWEIDAAALRVGAPIGDGEFGTVHAGTWHGGAPIAVKVLKRSDEVAVGDFRTELNVLQKVHHPNTCQFLGAVTRTAPFALVTELVRGGSVADWLRAARKGEAPLPTARRAAEIALDTVSVG